MDMNLLLQRLMAGESADAIAAEMTATLNAAMEAKAKADEEARLAAEAEAKRVAAEKEKEAKAYEYLTTINDAMFDYMTLMYPELNLSDKDRVKPEETKAMLDGIMEGPMGLKALLNLTKTPSIAKFKVGPNGTIKDKEIINLPTEDEILRTFLAQL